MWLEIPLDVSLALQCEPDGPSYAVQLLDLDDEAVLVRVPDELAQGEPPARPILSLVHPDLQWRGATPLKATFDGWWFLERPEQVAGAALQRREFVRIVHETSLLAIPTSATGLQTGGPVPMRTLNLGAGGCLVESEASLGQPGDRLLLILGLPGLPTLTLRGELIRHLSAPGTTGGRYALRFLEPDGSARDHLAQFIARSIQTQLQHGRDITLSEPA